VIALSVCIKKVIILRVYLYIIDITGTLPFNIMLTSDVYVNNTSLTTGPVHNTFCFL